MLSSELKQLRYEHGMKQMDFAALLGISASHLSNIESGREGDHVPAHIEYRAKHVLRKLAMAETKAEMKEQEVVKYSETQPSIILQEVAPNKVLMEVEGLAPDAPIVKNNKGGMQSHVPYRFDLFHAKSMFEMAKVLEMGARRYEPWNWLNIDIEDHLNHLIIHAYAYLAGDRSDEHLSHIMCRAMFAQGVELENKKKEENQNAMG